MIDVNRIRRLAGWESARIVLRDGQDRIYAGTGRGRAQRLARMVESLDWQSIELLSSKGEILDVVARDDAAEADDDSDERECDPVARQVAIIASETRKHTEIMRAVMGDAMRAYSQALSMLSGLIQQLAITHHQAIDSIRDAAIIASEQPSPPPSDGNGQDGALVQQILSAALPHLLAPSQPQSHPSTSESANKRDSEPES